MRGGVAQTLVTYYVHLSGTCHVIIRRSDIIPKTSRTCILGFQEFFNFTLFFLGTPYHSMTLVPLLMLRAILVECLAISHFHSPFIPLLFLFRN